MPDIYGDSGNVAFIQSTGSRFRTAEAARRKRLQPGCIGPEHGRGCMILGGGGWDTSQKIFID